MSDVDADNLRKIAHECRGLLREDILEAMEAAAVEIDRLVVVVRRLQNDLRAERALLTAFSTSKLGDE